MFFTGEGLTLAFFLPQCASFSVHLRVNQSDPGLRHAESNRFSVHTGVPVVVPNTVAGYSFFYQAVVFDKKSGSLFWSGINTSFGCIAHKCFAGYADVGPAAGFRSQSSVCGSRAYCVRCSKMAALTVRVQFVFILLRRSLAAAAAMQQQMIRLQTASTKKDSVPKALTPASFR